jgi:hypothetical protein
MRRPFIYLLILVALLALVYVLNSAAQSWRYVVQVPSGQVAYAAAFDGFEDEWTLNDGRNNASISDGRLLLNVGESGQIFFAPTRYTFGDVDLMVETGALGGPTNNGYGVFFRMTDASNYYSFQISSDGFYRLVRRINDREFEISTWIRSDLIMTEFGALNRLRVRAVGSDFQFWINDQSAFLCIPNDPNADSTYAGGACIEGTMQASVYDPSFQVGRVALGAFTEQTQGEDAINVQVQFDNLVILGG